MTGRSASPRHMSVPRTVRECLAWRGLEARRVRADRATMARTFTYLFGTGATPVLTSLLLPPSPDPDTTGQVPLPGLTWVMVTGTLMVLGSLTITLRSQLERLVGELGAAARTDSLTQLANRRELEDRFAAELERSTRTARPLSMVVLDLDWFKEYNDRFGHNAGDRALVMLAEALKRATRTSDVVARLGGEEFGVLAPETDETEGFLLAERSEERRVGKDGRSRW